MRAVTVCGLALAACAAAATARAEMYRCDAPRADLAAACGVERVDHVVCIDDFLYVPAVVTAKVGETIAWVNVEKCADPSGSVINLAEGLVANVVGTGCDTHHDVVTLPDAGSLSGDAIDAELCSPNRGIPAKPSLPTLPGFAVDAGSCADAGEEATNVFCHTFETAGAQHYTCLTNPAHTALLHGGIVVLP